MAQAGTPRRLTATIVWPVRAPIRPFKQTLGIGRANYLLAVDFPASVLLGGALAVPANSFTVLTVKWSRRFNGDRTQFLAWAKSPKGQTALLAEAELVVAEFVDRLHRLPVADRALVHCVRHFGPRDWISAKIHASKDVVFETIGSGIHYLVSSRAANVVPALRSPALSFEERTLHRAAELSDCGYPTESLLLSFSVLDAAVQRFLLAAMTNRGLQHESAENLLRNTTTKRLPTYLDSVLHLACGQSLVTLNPQVFKKVSTLNKLRNDAIHNGEQVDRRDARSACETVAEVLFELDRLLPSTVAGGIQLSFV